MAPGPDPGAVAAPICGPSSFSPPRPPVRAKVKLEPAQNTDDRAAEGQGYDEDCLHDVAPTGHWKLDIHNV